MAKKFAAGTAVMWLEERESSRRLWQGARGAKVVRELWERIRQRRWRGLRIGGGAERAEAEK